MSHHIYTTEAVVLSVRPHGEASMLVWLLTEELGLVIARAQALREEKSKMRYALQPLSGVRVALVRGREFWRVTSAEARTPSAVHPAAARVVRLVERLLVTEEADAPLYRAVRGALSDVSTKHAKEWEQAVVARILFHLGYLKERPEYLHLTETTGFSVGTRALVWRLQKLLARDISDGLDETHL